jgi:iron complex outermembrane recepter protein
LNLLSNAFYSGQAQTRFGVAGVIDPVGRTVEKFTHELRATVPFGESVTWLIGAFYTNERVSTHQDILAANPSTLAVAGTLYHADVFSTFQEYAAFSNLTVFLTPQFDVQFGGRLSTNKQTFSTVRSAPLAVTFFGSDPSAISQKDSSDTVFTYLVTPRYKLSDDLMVYARIASGYRPGGPNTGCGIPTVPCAFEPDTTVNYEAGVKGRLFGALTFDASVYHIEWKDIQLSLSVGGFGYQSNGSAAKSEGVELSVEGRPIEGMTISSWVVWNDAELSKDFPATSTVRGLKGDDLPYSSKFSGHIALDQEFSLGNDVIASLGGSMTIVDDRKGTFRSTLVRETFPGYIHFDLRAGLKMKDWTLNAFITNVTNERGILRSGVDAVVSNFVTYIQPRSMGVSLGKRF